MQEYIAEFLVAKALGLVVPQNCNGWTLWDILYNGVKIEIKSTAYYHSWRSDGKVSNRRSFGITKAYSKYQDSTSEYKRQNDIYIFCLNTGNTKEESNPLHLENWQFYVVPTKVIDKKCKDNKTIYCFFIYSILPFSDLIVFSFDLIILDKPSVFKSFLSISCISCLSIQILPFTILSLPTVFICPKSTLPTKILFTPFSSLYGYFPEIGT